MPSDSQITWPAIESLVRRDPGRRGVASFATHGTPLCPGHLAAAAQHLADKATTVALVTGFAIVDAQPIAPETDGPPGALFLARALVDLGVEVLLISDRIGMRALQVGCDFLGLPPSVLHEFPTDSPAASPSDARSSTSATPRADAWIEAFLRSPSGGQLSHLVAVERVGPSHTRQSLYAQRRNGPVPVEEFERTVPTDSRNVCHNMRGTPIDEFTAATHRLFEAVAGHPQITTIGIGDGGNEIGMGAIPWETLRAAIAVGPAERVACRVATDFTVLSGVSDWGAYALALAVVRLRGQVTRENHPQRELVERLVREAGAVDGVTGRREPTVDGLPLETYLQVLQGIRELLQK